MCMPYLGIAGASWFIQSIAAASDGIFRAFPPSWTRMFRERNYSIIKPYFGWPKSMHKYRMLQDLTKPALPESHKAHRV